MNRGWQVQRYRLQRVAELPAGAGNERDGFVPRMAPPFERVAFPKNPALPQRGHYWRELTGERGRVWLCHEYRAMYHALTNPADEGLIK